MKSLIIGANGGVGQHLVRKLKVRQMDFIAGVRNMSQVETLKSKGIDAVYIDVEKQSIDELATQFKQFDQILFSVGSGGSTGADMTMIVDLDGAIKAIKASEQVGNQHFIMVSTYDSRREAFDASGDLKPYTIAKHYADVYLRQTNLKYTIVHPGALTNEPETQKFQISEQFKRVQHPTITREDVAEVLVSVLSDKSLQGREFQIINGELPLTAAIQKYLEE
ncbi:TPA: SDR family oxidoreductase [Staphylococcus pseudintermedius]|uniref:NAD(P)-binding oxidoreductase n=1 Tax=Staphylococcus pseudintermedius TaxID=283734 RepID=UPI00296D51FD|nr:SDR family oxidoreductase [Staphylococcus pseudintermedius]HAR6020432.1 SDR family oxidoreductase [Staphylococcus pseudintermedius]